MTSFDALEHAFESHTPDVLINCSGYTAVDAAESDSDAAHSLNVETPERLATLCKRFNTILVHFSTDYVFDGSGSTAYTEEDPPLPASVYGATKREGERRILQSDARAIVLRVSWLYSQHGKNFYKTMLRLARENGQLRVVNDQIASPTYAADVVEAVGSLLEARASGLFHFSNAGQASWYDFAAHIIAGHGMRIPIEPVSSTTFETPAKRPSYSKLNTQKFHNTTSRAPRHWKQALTNCIACAVTEEL